MPLPDNLISREEKAAFIACKAFEVFQKYGIGGTTMQLLAEHIGISPALIYRYFDNKDSLVLYLYNLEPRLDTVESCRTVAGLGDTNG